MKSKLKLEMLIEQKQARIDSGIISNERTIKYAKRSIKKWKQELRQIGSEVY